MAGQPIPTSAARDRGERPREHPPARPSLTGVVFLTDVRPLPEEQIVSQMLEFALYYLSMGWSIIPQRPGDKKPLVKWKRFQELPPDRAQVEEWWTRWPDAGICLVLGSVSGLVAVDVDSSEAERVFFELQGGEPTTLKSLSGSRKSSKAHYLFHCPDFPTTAKYTPLNKQLEFRGHGGYIVLPPSLHHSGNRYAWSEPLQPIAALPEALDAVWRANPRFAPKTPRPSRRRPNLRIDSGATDAPDIIAQDEPASLITILRLAGLADSTQKWLIGCFSHQAGWNQNLFCAACDLAGLGVPMEEAEPRFEESVEVMTKAFTSRERFSHHGKFWQFDKIVVEPPPSAVRCPTRHSGRRATGPSNNPVGLRGTAHPSPRIRGHERNSRFTKSAQSGLGP